MSRSSKGKEGLIVVSYFAITIVACGVDKFAEGHLSRPFLSFILFIWAVLFVSALIERLDAILDYAEQIKEQNEELKGEVERLTESVDEIEQRTPKPIR